MGMPRLDMTPSRIGRTPVVNAAVNSQMRGIRFLEFAFYYSLKLATTSGHHFLSRQLIWYTSFGENYFQINWLRFNHERLEDPKIVEDLNSDEGNLECSLSLKLWTNTYIKGLIPSDHL